MSPSQPHTSAKPSSAVSGMLSSPRLHKHLNLFTVRRSDMGGNASNPLGEFSCNEPGDYQITCLTLEHIRPGFQREVSPYVSPATFVPLILGTLFSAAMALGGLVTSLIILNGMF